ncbi:MAG: FkbM family methyltransferase [Tahibacter sp.]
MIHSKIRLGFSDYVQRQIRAAMVARLTRSNAQKQSTGIACFPRDYIGRHIIANGAYEDLLLRCLFEQTFAARLAMFKTTAALDVGANIGNHSAWFARHFQRVIAFEPNPICAHLFEASRMMNRLSGVRLFPCGLSDRDGTAVLLANLRGNLGGSRIAEPGEPLVSDSFDILVRRGDGVLTEAKESSAISLIKLDVEGHEHAAIHGLEQTIRTNKPIVLFEAQGSRGYNGSLAILDSLAQMGYRRTYVMLADARRSSNRLARLFQRVVRGFEICVVEVDQPEDRYYSLIIATVDPL